jgi:ABC-2 type transport system ATP-binding protein
MQPCLRLHLVETGDKRKGYSSAGFVGRAVIEAEGLVKVYGGRRGTRALDGVSFSVPKGDIFGFLGPNGAGKTTTIRILATVLEPTSGAVRVSGQDLEKNPMAIKEKIGVMPDEVAFYPTLTGVSHLRYYASFYGIPRTEAKRRSRELLDQVGIGDAANKKVKAYSHGMKKRLVLAQALLHDPEYLIMDEPASGLDPQGMRYFRDLIRFLNGKGKTIFLSSHLLHEVEQLCEHVGIIDRGRMVAVDSISNLTTRLAAGAPNVIHVSADGVTPAAISAVEAIPGVIGVESTPRGLDIRVQPGSDVSSEVSRALIMAGAQLRELKAEQRTLEDLFLALTKGGRP